LKGDCVGPAVSVIVGVDVRVGSTKPRGVLVFVPGVFGGSVGVSVAVGVDVRVGVGVFVGAGILVGV
jgi:hypothetical protein